MRHFAVSAIGRDMPGIVAAVSNVLLDHAGNIEDSQMTILRGHFTMMLIVSTPDQVDPDALASGLEDAAGRLALEAISLNEVTEISADSEAEPTHMISVYGADHPGIVHAVSTALAERGISITDLTTRLAGEDSGEPLYSMMLEVALTPGASVEELQNMLIDVASGQAVDVSVHRLDQDTL